MNAFIDFIMGPMVWISLSIFIAGLIIKFIKIMIEVNRKESFIFSYMSFKYGFRSIGAWLIPFLPVSTRRQPIFWGTTYIFHFFLFIVPLFLSAHVILFDESFGISCWPMLNDKVADLMTIVIIISLIFFACRRIIKPEIQFLTTSKDYFLLFIVLFPFLTGFVAYHQIVLYQQAMILHVLSGELMLIFIPFSRLSHMLTAPLTRAYIGSEFGRVRHARDW